MLSNYSFRDLFTTDEVLIEDIPEEGIVFGDWDSRERGWFLLERSAPTPSEQEVVETVPFRQGVFDFSAYNGDRYFKNREITYTFLYLRDDYEDRKLVEHEIKRELLPQTISNLVDTHDRFYHWSGKVKSISVTDDQEFGTLKAEVVFDCYPFAIRNGDEFDDIWDDVYFPHWIFMHKRYTVNSNSDITIPLINIGSHMMIGEMKVVSGSVTVNSKTINAGQKMELEVSRNTVGNGRYDFKVKGNGVIEFSAYREEMI